MPVVVTAHRVTMDTSFYPDAHFPYPPAIRHQFPSPSIVDELQVTEKHHTEMYPGFQIMGSSGPLLEKLGGPLLSFGGPANL